MASKAKNAQSQSIQTKPERIPSGTFREGEPSPEEIVHAITNEPGEETFKLGEDPKEHPLLDFTMTEGLAFFMTFVPLFQESIRGLMPMFGTVIRSAFLIRGFSTEVQEAIFVIARDSDFLTLYDTLKNMGVSEPKNEEVEVLQAAARGDRSLEFLVTLGTIFFGPLLEPLRGVVLQTDFTALLEKQSHKLGYLVKLIAKSSFKRRNEEFDEAWFEKHIELTDPLNAFDIVYRQYDRYRQRGGKFARFFAQATSLRSGPKSTSGETPSASTTPTTP